MFEQFIPKLKAGEISVSTDTRTIKSGDIFFAIKGEQFDGHAFVEQAFEKGASVCAVSKDFAGLSNDPRCIIVDDTLKALQSFAAQYRKEFSIPVVGISGCNGKTTTKNFMASVLKEHFGQEDVLYTVGNHNNFIGVPLTILSLRSHHKAAVIELGSNHPGEIAELCHIAQPTHGITTNIGAAHIEFFGTLEAIADEEGAIATYIPKGGTYVLPKNDQYSEYISQKTKPGVDVHFVDIKHIECFGTDFINFQSKLNQIGIVAQHIITDALLVTTVAHKLGLTCSEILKGLSETKNDKGRFGVIKVDIESSHSATVSATLIDDTYNGNPDSVIAAIKAMKDLFPENRKIVALGVLKELGEYTHTGYERIVNVCNEYNVSELLLINIEDTFPQEAQSDVSVESNSGMTKLVYVKDNLECAEYIKKNMQIGDVILCKGSNGAKTWEVIEGIQS